MASTFSRKDLHMSRSDRYTPAAANEARAFIEECLGEQLVEGNLLDALKDGVALCRLVNLAVPGTLRFKAKAQMPFVQMENISLFIEACKNHPFNLQSHDIFLTIDLYESKDPAQVLQCLGAFSRALHRIDPVRFPNQIGARSRTSPQVASTPALKSPIYQGRNSSAIGDASSNKIFDSKYISINSNPNSKTNNLRYGGDASPKNYTGIPMPSETNISDKKSSERTLSPPWNIVQYGYTGGASQANLGVTFGGRRQITSVGPNIPIVSDREKRQKENAIEIESFRVKTEKFENQRQEQVAIEEEVARNIEDLRWVEEAKEISQNRTRDIKDENRIYIQNESGLRQDEQYKTNPILLKRQSCNNISCTQLKAQYSSKSLADDFCTSKTENPESNRVKELEHELELAREREREYERARSARVLRQSSKNTDQGPSGHSSPQYLTQSLLNRSHAVSRKKSEELRQFKDLKNFKKQSIASKSTSDLKSYNSPIVGYGNSRNSPRPLPEIVSSTRNLKQQTGSRPLPDPIKYATVSCKSFSKNEFSGNNKNINQQPKTSAICITSMKPTSGTACSLSDECQEKSQTPVKVGSWPAKSLLDREMEMERKRQQEWEESQRELKGKVQNFGNGVVGIGGGIGGRWDISQWAGYTGGDSQNKGMQGIGSGRRQIVGPRPEPII
ncbi:putative calponin-like protein [Erysiphe necator]|uniref:Putative calponin-like protein n=1 Tax=Uncinula necator TaxID=52586 RepID=A0A0B1PE27_UNCNE|nr:putative calponin-like protein [Erysiphe necator]